MMKLSEIGKVRALSGTSISSVVFSKDSKSLFCACGCQLKKYCVSTGELVSVYEGHNDQVTDLCINPNNQLQLISCSLNGDVYFWDILDGSIITKCKSQYSLHGVTVHKDHPNTLFIVKRNDKRKDKFLFGKSSLSSENKGLHEVNSCLKFDKICKIISCPDAFCFSEKGEQVAVVSKHNLQIWYFKEEILQRHYCKAEITSVAYHPHDACIATGHDNGKIFIWKNIKLDSEPIRSKLHWHAHSVASLKFSHDGAYLYSGGEESVLVFWQVDSNHKQFKPRLGAPIAHICNSDDDALIAVSHVDNVINLVSAVDLSVVNVVQGLTRANKVYSGLVADPCSKSLVLNNKDGSLQFYRPETDCLSFTLDIVQQNYISRLKNTPLQLIVVEHVKFSDDGSWLATIERRDDGKMTPENRLKFWKYNKKSQRHVLNTCIDPPHEGKVISMEFQPGTSKTQLAMSASIDGKFKIWIVKQQHDINEYLESWHCQSVGYFRDEPVSDAAFSSDGSLLAVVYGKVITLWDPYINEQKKTLCSPFAENIRNIAFGRKVCSHILLATTKHYFMAWNLLSCGVLWSTKAEVLSILPDPCSYLVTTFVKGAKQQIDVYIFDARSVIPLAIEMDVIKDSQFLAAAFQLNTRGLTVPNKNDNITMAKLFYMSKKQILYTIDDVHSDEVFPKKGSENMSEDVNSEFHRVFGVSQKQDQTSTVTDPARIYRNTSASSKVIREMLSAPSHALPPVKSLCSKLLHSLLISKERNSVTAEHEDVTSDDDDMKEMDIGEDETSSDEDIADSDKLDTKITIEVQEGYLNRDDDLPTTDFDWMKEIFQNMP
ncbi:WD repeat-containing protein 75-like [Xenia sp. Carnegie-2017]|uniref:WD repeat-containing protein 75-like n=1 Tax=Xenia sp. Carnegie-2017 TaxID=2897299 RepID=UPI001F04E355|nr:WD repeat-containing protein 75-like [Xenia sp. Carnegie-2017]